MDIFQFDDPIWVEDYQRALGELVEDQKLLPPPPREKDEHFWTLAPKEKRNVEALEGSALRLAILEGMSIRKCADPLFREIWWDGKKVGEVAQSPFQPFCWVSSRQRKHPFSSLKDAACYTVADYLGKNGHG